METTGDERVTLVAREWRVDGGLLLESLSSTGDHHLVIVDDDLGTRAWRFENARAGVAIESKLLDGVIVVEGVQSGRPIEEAGRTDETRWLQSLERSLRDFVLTAADGERLAFVVLQPDTLKVRALQARVHDAEDRVVAGVRTPVRRVRVSLPGIAAILWRSDYWFRMPDGLFVESRVTRGPPGTRETVVALVEDTGPAPRR